MINQKQRQQIIELAQEYSVIKLLYIFGSRAKGQSGPLSDYDLAVYLDGLEQPAVSELRLDLIDQLSRIFTTDEVDLVVLNRLENPLLGYQIITEGELIYQQEPYRLLVEPKLLNQHFDFQRELQKNGLTRVKK